MFVPVGCADPHSAQPASYRIGSVGHVIELALGHELQSGRTEVFTLRYLERRDAPAFLEDIASTLAADDHAFWRDISAPRLRVMVLGALHRLARRGLVRSRRARDAHGRVRRRFQLVPAGERRRGGFPGGPPLAG